MKEEIIDILSEAVQAPSGDNSQPWNFLITGSHSFEVWNIPGRDNQILNYHQAGSYVAHGALLENIKIVSSKKGYTVEIEKFPKGEGKLTAKIKLIKNRSVFDELSLSVMKRHTNRKKYQTKQLSLNEKESIISEAHKVSSNAQFHFSPEKFDQKSIASALSLMERIALEVPELHKTFFKDVLWSKKENEIGKPGLYIKTLELPLPAQLAMKLLRYWQVTNFLNKSIGLSKKISKQMADIYATSPIWGAISIPDRSGLSYLAVGEKVARVWTEANRLGLAVQPVTGLLFLAIRAQANDLSPIPDYYTKEILNAYNQIQTLFPEASGRHIAFLLRFGHSKPPSVKTKRLPPVII